MAVLVEWDQLKMTSFLMIPMLILCMTTAEFMAQPALENCTDPLGMESGAIRDDQITASSELTESYPPHIARLHGTSAWFPNQEDSNPWIQVDFEQNLCVTGVATQGFPRGEYWSTAFSIQHGADGMALQTIQDDQNLTQTFLGNVDRDTRVKNKFTSPISLRYIRIHPTEQLDVPALRFELYGCKASDLTTISPPISSTNMATNEESLKIGSIIGGVIGSFFILLIGLVAFIFCRKRVCKKHKADKIHQPSAKDNSAKSGQNQDNYEPYRKGGEQAPSEELQKSHVTNGANSEKLAGKHESVLYLEPMETKSSNQEGKPSSQCIKSGNQGIKTVNNDTRLGNLDESDQDYEEIRKSKISLKAMKTKPGKEGIKPGNQETEIGYQGESDQIYEEINKGENRVSDGELYAISNDPSTSNGKPVQSKAALNESLHHTYFDPKIPVSGPVYGNASVLKFVGK